MRYPTTCIYNVLLLAQCIQNLVNYSKVMKSSSLFISSYIVSLSSAKLLRHMCSICRYMVKHTLTYTKDLSIALDTSVPLIFGALDDFEWCRCLIFECL